MAVSKGSHLAAQSIQDGRGDDICAWDLPTKGAEVKYPQGLAGEKHAKEVPCRSPLCHGFEMVLGPPQRAAEALFGLCSDSSEDREYYDRASGSQDDDATAKLIWGALGRLKF